MKTEQQIADELHKLFDKEDKVRKVKTRTHYFCSECSRVLARKYIHDSVCPKCGLPFKAVEREKRPKFHVVALGPSWTLPNGHPDYKFITGSLIPIPIPRVNLICIRCKHLFQHTYLLSDLENYFDKNREYNGWRSKELFTIKHPTEAMEIIELSKVQNSKCTDGNPHSFRRVHRLISGMPSKDKFPPPNNCLTITLDIDFGLAIDISEIDDRKRSEKPITSLDPGPNSREKTLPHDPISDNCSCPDCNGKDTIHVRTVIHEGEYGLLIAEDRKFSFNASTCFIPPPGFEYNPVSEMDDETIDEIIEGMNKKNEAKCKSMKVK